MGKPKQQKIEYYWSTEVNDNTLEKECMRWIDMGWVVHQIIPKYNSDCFYILLYKY